MISGRKQGGTRKTGSKWNAPNSNPKQSEQRMGDILKEELQDDWPVMKSAGRSPDMMMDMKISASVATERKEDGEVKEKSS